MVFRKAKRTAGAEWWHLPNLRSIDVPDLEGLVILDQPLSRGTLLYASNLVQHDYRAVGGWYNKNGSRVISGRIGIARTLSTAVLVVRADDTPTVFRDRVLKRTCIIYLALSTSDTTQKYVK